MLNDWRTWCRLCANECATFKMESLDELNEILTRHFKLSIQDHDEVCSRICEGCYNFINKLDYFEERCLQTSKMLVQMYEASINSDELIESYIQDLRLRFLSDPLVPFVDSDTDRGTQEDIKTTIEVQESQVMQEERGYNSKRSSRKMATKNKNRNKNTLNDISESDSDFDVDQDEDYNALNECDSNSEKEAEAAHSRNMNDTRIKPSYNKKIKPKCEICDITFGARSLYVSHLRKKHPDSKELSFVCSSCNERFLSQRELTFHELSHIPSDQTLDLLCEYCDKKFSDPRVVDAHVLEVHCGARKYICAECKQAFATKDELKGHECKSKEKRFLCAHCPKKFKNLCRLKIHEDTHKDTSYVCPDCGLALNTRRTLQMHMIVHSDQKKYKCDFCGNEYKRSKTLKNHLVIHTGEKPYMCPFCGKTFAFGSACRIHKKKVHPKEVALLDASKK
ncbi:zinc finger protein 486-like isoform X2 [Armigeres subalbatus]|uniref:zinc finger protein 486-like isoform X2 n=1 Tax=Armigeres subalbatus TaxID=124917 RepID=UPI002ED3C5BE